VDLADITSLLVKGEEAKALFGRVDILINNAGISYRGSINDTDIDVHQNVMTVNYFGQIALTKGICYYCITCRLGIKIRIFIFTFTFARPRLLH